MLTKDETARELAKQRYQRKLDRFEPVSKRDSRYPTPDEWTARHGAGGVVTCDCPAWRFSRAEPKTCKHAIAFIAKNEVK